jgi:hypothetical protein
VCDPIATPALASALLVPARDRLAVDPVGGPADLGGGDEQLRRQPRRPPQRLDRVGHRVVGGDREAAARQVVALAAVELLQLPQRQRPEPEQAQEAELAAEAARVEVDPLLPGLQLAGEAVVDQDRVGAGQPPPLLRGRVLADPLPEGEVLGQLPPPPRARRGEPRQPPEERQAPGQPRAPRRLAPGRCRRRAQRT